MRWHDLLFAHWPIDLKDLRAAIARSYAASTDQWSIAGYDRARERQSAGELSLPQGLEIDTFDGQAYIGVVPFHMTHATGRFLPSVPGLSTFAEINLRTYVTVGGKPGVLFFSLDAASPAAVWAARRWWKLPYFHAYIHFEHHGDAIGYNSVRTHALSPQADFVGRYEPAGPVYAAAPGSLDHWLTERYCLYSLAGPAIIRGEIHHARWPLQPARAEISTNTMALAQGIALPETPPLLHFTKRLDVLGWAPEVAAIG
ncbi:MAG: DUF2071 domain-containing protein [Planctomycetes bacterium]|nr:DUF2071 domain-containing protein [Planctomycetota bacterium]